MTDKQIQLDKFKKAAQRVGCGDYDEARFDERVRNLVNHKPAEKSE